MKLMWLSDSSLIHTGFSSQSKLVMKTMQARGHEIIHVAHNYVGQPINKVSIDDGEEINYKILPGNPRQPFCGPQLLQEYVNAFRPDKFGTLLDSFMFWEPRAQYARPWIMDVSLPESHFWIPSDGGWFPEGCEAIVRRFTKPVSMSRYCQEQLKSLHNIETDYIPHGIKTQHFYPLPDDLRQALRQKYVQKFWAFHDGIFTPFPIRNFQNKFVVGCVARNQPRKMMDRTMKAFCKFAQDKDDVMLLLHSDPFDMSAGMNVQGIAHRFGQGHKVWWTGMKWWDAFPTSGMNDIYNLLDAQLMLTSGEGFGIPIIEGMACEVPQVVTDYTTTKELIVDNNAGYGVQLASVEKESPYPAEKILDGTTLGTWSVERGLGSIHHAAQCLQELYDDDVLRRKLGRNGRQAVLDKYDWDRIVGPAWVERFER